MSREDKSKKGKSYGRQGGGSKKVSGRQGGKMKGESYGRGYSPSRKPTPKKNQLAPDEIRLNKYISNSGVCSRRDADIYIASGNVTVNGKVVTEMGYKVKLTDEVKFDGRKINPEKKEYILLNKPKGFITTTNDEKGRRTVMDLVKNATKSNIVPVGRLDRNTIGLLLFTNDGDLAKKLTHPKHGVRKIYHVALDKNFKGEDLLKVKEGLRLEDGEIKVDEISFIDGGKKNEVGVKIHSGRNRIVRRIFQHLDYEVVKLDRVVFAGLTKKDLPRGTWRHLTKQEVINLRML
ncbi:pseudouridine synthase [Galbibacter sp. EGI 63066]|uniref:pseudouridine synthase n=1 Tax=Galbibacter sp. EGI 63066 TaxID=2993559 RepID=UPI002248BC51|nr:pseudouridine synthase [Galbibacter sp. EGI 63066]MCX2679921.1 pseudouridine synthase [Galbibacter sp. EGI 63066]